MTDLDLLPATQHRRMRWANGGGWTTEIIAEPSSGHWEWRLSVADVDVAGPFSLFPGVDRSIALLRGAGFALTVGGRDEEVIDLPHHPFQFAGDEVTTCRLLDGAVQDLNLMTTRGSGPRRLDFIHIPPLSTIDLSGVDVLVVVGGRAQVAGHDLGYLDAIHRARPGPITVNSRQDGAVVTSATALSHG
ncbi:MAG TPA: HutD family protein [Ilumatobacteraceae bacterium]|nr:HutD family protein [Ilumatobacteraceae bacterium]